MLLHLGKADGFEQAGVRGGLAQEKAKLGDRAWLQKEEDWEIVQQR